MTAAATTRAIPPSIAVLDGQPLTPTASGGIFPLLDPSPDRVDFRDIAEGLAKACRFAGQIPVFYSVAQHSVMVAEMLPVEARPYGLIHDAHEAFVGDLISPVKEVLAILGGRAAWETMIGRLDAAIHAAAGLPWPPPPNVQYLVKCADLVALATEYRDVNVRAPVDEMGIVLPPPLRRAITPWPWHRALDAFHDRCRRWLPNPGR